MARVVEKEGNITVAETIWVFITAPVVLAAGTDWILGMLPGLWSVVVSVAAVLALIGGHDDCTRGIRFRDKPGAIAFQTVTEQSLGGHLALEEDFGQAGATGMKRDEHQELDPGLVRPDLPLSVSGRIVAGRLVGWCRGLLR